MRWSIKKIFDNLSKTLLILTITLGILSTITFTLNSSVKKVDLLLEQKALIKETYNLGREDIQLSKIQLRGIINTLKYDISKMRDAYSFDILGNYVYGHTKQYINDLEQLQIKQLLYIEAADSYYEQSLEDLENRLDDYDFAQAEYEAKLFELEEKHLIYETEKFNMLQYIIYFAFIISLLATLWFTRRLSFVYTDIRTLYSVDSDSKNRMFQTEEAEMIIKRLSRKPSSTENPAFTDPVTGINNYKGLLHGFANRKGNTSPSLTVCLFSLDHFKDIEKKYKKDLANQILNKIAFIFSLHEQHTDILGRIDYDQFVLILNRNTKDIALNDCEQIRKTIEETKFKVPKGESISITVSGGFVVKTPNKPLDQTITHAKEILHAAISQGGNRIAQLRDRAEKELR